MQKKFVWCVLLMILCTCIQAQPIVGNSELARELYAKAKGYTAKKDYPNAILVYNQLASLEPRNLIYRRELSYAYYLGGDLSRATQVITPLLKAKEADEATFLTASQIFSARNMNKAATGAVERGIKKFPESGLLYSDLGRLYSAKKKYQKAEAAWEKGVKYEPNYHLNYYQLAKSYFVSKRPLWAIIYGETFINMERYSSRSEEIKKIVFDSYKQLIANNQLARHASDVEQKNIRRGKSDFEKKINDIYSQLSNIVLGGVDINNVVMLRTRFLLRWSQIEGQEYPFQLFDFTNNLLAFGHFEAYNQWLFGKAADSAQYINWVKANSSKFEDFENFYRSYKFTTTPGQYYK